MTRWAIYPVAFVLAVVAFASGAILAGLLGCWLMKALRQAGAIGAHV